MMTMILMIMLLGFMFVLSFHPLSLALILIMNTLLMSLVTGLMNLNFWYSFMLFMIMIGGMLVLIMYMTSIASNEMFELPWKYLTIGIMILWIMVTPDTLEILNHTMTLDKTNMMTWPANLSLNKYVSFTHIAVIITLINYLFLTLIAIVKITNIKYGSLRQKS